MPKIKYTKNELKHQRNALQRYQRYLPTLELKKAQLQIEVRKVDGEISKKLAEELLVTAQRVNLFEKTKIPECLSNIRKIRIYLGDEQAAAVSRAKAEASETTLWHSASLKPSHYSSWSS